MSFETFEAADAAIEAMNGQFLFNKPITVQYAYKKDGKGERHGSAAERELAAKFRKQTVTAAAPNRFFAEPGKMPTLPGVTAAATAMAGLPPVRPVLPPVGGPPSAPTLAPGVPALPPVPTLPPPGMALPGFPSLPPPGLPFPGFPTMPPPGLFGTPIGPDRASIGGTPLTVSCTGGAHAGGRGTHHHRAAAGLPNATVRAGRRPAGADRPAIVSWKCVFHLFEAHADPLLPVGPLRERGCTNKINKPTCDTLCVFFQGTSGAALVLFLTRRTRT